MNATRTVLAVLLAVVLGLGPAVAAAGAAAGTAQLRGVLLDAEGMPAHGYQVGLRNADGDLFLSTATGPDGSFAVQIVPPGKYELVAFAPDGSEFPVLSKPVTLKEGQVARLEIRLGAKGFAPGHAPARAAAAAGKGGGAAAAGAGGTTAAAAGALASWWLPLAVVVGGAFAVNSLDDNDPGPEPEASPSSPL